MSAVTAKSRVLSKQSVNDDDVWSRPLYWLPLPDISSEQAFVGLHAVFEDCNYVSLSATNFSGGLYQVDWGDGVIETFASNVQCYHQYDYATFDAANATLVTHNNQSYKQAIVKVTTIAGNFSGLDLKRKHNAAGLTNNYATGWLDITVNSTSMTALVISSASSTLVTHALLEQATIKSHAQTSMANMFYGCVALESVPLFNTASVTAMSNMFVSCVSLKTVPLFNTASVTTMVGMFNTCSSLATVPLFNTASVTTMSSMFVSCVSLETVPLFNTALVTSFDSAFNGCSKLKTVPLFNTASVTSMNSMFAGCTSLETVPLFNTVSLSVATSMFSNCTSLKEIPAFNTPALTQTGSMFSACTSLISVPLFNTASVITMSTMFQNNSKMVSVPAFNFSSATSVGTAVFTACRSLTKINATGFKLSFSVSACKLSKAALELLFSNLGLGTSQTLTITTNPGADTVVSKTTCGKTAGSTVITQTNTANLGVGMTATGVGTPLTTPIACTFTDAGDLVNETAHGLSNGDRVSFAAITTTTGIIINTRYYVVNATTDTFQISETIGGVAKTLTTDGTGSVRYPAKIESIVTNTSITLDRPCTSTGSNTLAFRLLDTSNALLRGWTITG